MVSGPGSADRCCSPLRARLPAEQLIVWKILFFSFCHLIIIYFIAFFCFCAILPNVVSQKLFVLVVSFEFVASIKPSERSEYLRIINSFCPIF